MNMWLIAWRNMRRRKMRTLLTVMAIVIGVASTFAVIASVQTAKTTVPQYLKAAFGKADYTVSSINAYFLEDIFHETNALPNTEAVAILKQSTKLYYEQGDFADFQKRVDLIGYSELNTALTAFKVIDGDLAASGAVITDKTAAVWKVKAGDKITFNTDNGLKQIPVTAIVNYTMELMGPSNWMMAKYHPWSVALPLEVVQEWFDLEGSIQEVQVKSLSAAPAGVLEGQLNDLVKQYDGIYMQPVIVELDSKSNDVNMFYSALYIAGFLGITLSAFVIFNSFYVSMRERLNEFAILKSIGYTSNQLQSFALIEVILLAIIGTAVGLLLGWGFAYLLKAIIFMLLNVNGEGGVQLALGAIVAALSGLTVPIIAAIYPVLQASRVSVIAVMKQAPSESASRYRWQGIAGVVLVGTSLFMNSLALIVPLLLGVILLYPYLFKLLMLVLKPLFKLLGFSSSVAASNLKRNLGRVSMTSVILCLGITMIVLTSSLNSALIETYNKAIHSSYGGDLDIMLHHIEEGDLERLEEVDGVKAATTYRQMSAVWTVNEQKRNLPIYGVEGDWIDQFPLFTAGDQKQSEVISGLQPQELVMDKIALEVWGGEIGDSIVIDTVDGQRTYTVVGVVETMKNSGYSAFMNEDQFIQSFGAKYEKNALVIKEENISSLQLRENIFDEFGEDVMEMFGPEDWVSVIGSVYTGSFSIINFLIILSIIISAIGITNTLMMNVMERIRELAMLRAIGVVRGQVMRMVLWEGLGIGLVATLLGCMLGIWLVGQTSSYFEISALTFQFNVSWTIVLFIALFGIIISLLASIVPAKKASKISLSEALRYE